MYVILIFVIILVTINLSKELVQFQITPYITNKINFTVISQLNVIAICLHLEHCQHNGFLNNEMDLNYYNCDGL